MEYFNGLSSVALSAIAFNWFSLTVTVLAETKFGGLSSTFTI